MGSSTLESFEASVCVVEVNTGHFQTAVRVIELFMEMEIWNNA